MPKYSIYTYSFIAMSIALSILILVRIFVFRGYGIDFTDEGFYLNWISGPFVYDSSTTQFGFVYNYIYILLFGNISSLRLVNVYSTFLLSWCLVHLFLSAIAPEIRVGRWTLYVISAGFAVSSLISFDTWMLTPNYNSLALNALIITSIGFVLLKRDVTYKSLAGAVLIGVGGWLAFMAKPSTALALAIGVFFSICISSKFSVRLVILSAAVSALLLAASAMIIDGSIEGFVLRIHMGVEAAGYLGGGHTFSNIVRMDSFNPRSSLVLIVLVVSVFSILILYFFSRIKYSCLLFSIILILCIFTILVNFDFIPIGGRVDYFQEFLIFGVALAAVVYGLFSRKLRRITRPQWTIAGLFLVMPYIYAFGTNGNYWRSGSSAGIFWLLAALTLLAPMARERASWVFTLPLVFVTQAVTATLLQTGWEQPYRQPESLRVNDTAQKIGPADSTLMLSSDYAAYIQKAMLVADGAGFEPATLVIDLSGQSPGLLYALKAESLGQPWIIGGYPGSAEFAEAALSRISCEQLAMAWVLLEPDGPRSIPVELMANLGTRFPANYEKAGAWETAAGAGGHADRRTQELYKPMAPNETSKTCMALRRG